jgi:hypothetical protein
MRQLRRLSLLVGTAAAVADVQHARVILVRHGETNYNAEGRIQGRLESVLTAKGQGHAAALGEWLADNEPSSSTREGVSCLRGCAHGRRSLALPMALYARPYGGILGERIRLPYKENYRSTDHKFGDQR